MKNAISTFYFITLFCFSFIQCKNNENNGNDKEEVPPSDSQPSDPIEMKLNLQKDKKICETPIVIKATIDWLENRKWKECIDLQAVKLGCDKDIDTYPSFDAGIIGPGGEGTPIGVDTDLPVYDFGCEPGVTRSIAIN